MAGRRVVWTLLVVFLKVVSGLMLQVNESCIERNYYSEMQLALAVSSSSSSSEERMSPDCQVPHCKYMVFTERKTSIDRLRWGFETGADFIVLFREDEEERRICFDKLFSELRVRPLRRFIWGNFDHDFVAVSRDVAAMTLVMVAEANILDPFVLLEEMQLIRYTDKELSVFNCQNAHSPAIIRVNPVSTEKGLRLVVAARALARKLEKKPPRDHSEASVFIKKQERPKDQIGIWWSVIEKALTCNTSDDYMCTAYRGRSLCPECETAVLASFPGSGNTWTRLLLEYGAGLATGSVYDDNELKRALPAEGNRDQVLAIKAHILPRQYIQQTHPKRIILLTRHPLDAVWAEFQRRIGALLALDDSHVHALTSLGPAMRQLFGKFAACMSCKWALYALAHEGVSVEVHYARYESFVHDAPKALSAALQFLGVDNIDQERLACAPKLALDKKIRRHSATGKKLKAIEVFQSVPGDTLSIGCEAWRRVVANPASRALVAKMGYQPPNDLPGDYCLRPTSAIQTQCGSPNSRAGNCFATVDARRLKDAMRRDSTSEPQTPAHRPRIPRHQPAADLAYRQHRHQINKKRSFDPLHYRTKRRHNLRQHPN